jgi:putative flippase GtrA
MPSPHHNIRGAPYSCKALAFTTVRLALSLHMVVVSAIIINYILINYWTYRRIERSVLLAGSVLGGGCQPVVSCALTGKRLRHRKH